MTRGHNFVLGLLAVLSGLALCGCSGPTIIQSPSSPGAGSPRIPPAEKEPAQALGEPNMRAPVDPSRKSAVPGTISPPTAIGETKTTPSGVKYETLKAGDGP